MECKCSEIKEENNRLKTVASIVNLLMWLSDDFKDKELVEISDIIKGVASRHESC